MLGGKEEAPERSAPDLTVRAGRGSFQLSNLRLVRESGSTKLRGRILNRTGRKWGRAVFELRAFNARGERLKGAEGRTTFQVNDLDEDGAAPLDYGYGIWLEAIPIESVSTLEVVLITSSVSNNSRAACDGGRLRSQISPDAEE